MAKTPEEEKADFLAKVADKKTLEADISTKSAKKNKTIDDLDEILGLILKHLGIT